MGTRKLSVTLPRSTLYVSGTVNDVAVTWTLQEHNVWEAIADRAADDMYRVSLTIISASGQSTNAAFTLYYGLLQLITDRTQEDVNEARELSVLGWANMSAQQKDDYLNGLKGAYNATDLNRVGGAVNYVASRLVEAGYAINVSPKLNWTVSDTPTWSDLTTYLDNISEIRSTLTVPPSTPPAPDDMAGLTYQEANNIEQILLDVDALITNMINAYFYSNEIQCGEV